MLVRRVLLLLVLLLLVLLLLLLRPGPRVLVLLALHNLQAVQVPEGKERVGQQVGEFFGT